MTHKIFDKQSKKSTRNIQMMSNSKSADVLKRNKNKIKINENNHLNQ